MTQEWATEEEMREQCEGIVEATGCSGIHHGFCDRCWFQTGAHQCIKGEVRVVYARAMLEGKLVLVGGELCFVEEG